jgi:hypothetical protein
MQFDDALIQEIEADPYGRTLRLVQEVLAQLHISDPAFSDSEWDQEEYELLLEAGAFITELIGAAIVPLALTPPTVGDTMREDCSTLVGFLYAVEKHCTSKAGKERFSGMRNRFKAALGNTFSYQFSDGDLQRVQSLVNEIREKLSATDNLDDDHRRRLLLRLEKLQAELHKKMSDLDRFWGLVGDASVVMAKLGDDAKPIVDRIRELTGIVWNTQARAEELPSGTKPPLLGYSPDEEQQDKVGMDS